jgi:hypothetical protein
MFTLQVPVPEQAPLHPPNIELAPGETVSVTGVPCANLAEHVVGQLIPAGLLVTVPVPETLTVSFSVALNVAVTVLAALTVTLQAPVPEHAPLHPLKVELAPGEAVSVTCVPCAKLAEHDVGQLMPAGALVTVPAPVAVTVNESEVIRGLEATEPQLTTAKAHPRANRRRRKRTPETIMQVSFESAILMLLSVIGLSRGGSHGLIRVKIIDKREAEFQPS